MKTNNKFYSTRTYSLKKDHNILNISNLKLTNTPKIYHPINPTHPFNMDLLNIKEISKRKIALLINNKSLKDKILKYRMQERKNSNESYSQNKYLYSKFKDEEKKYQLTIRAILKKEFDNFPLHLSERKSTENKKKKKINLKIAFSRNDVGLESNKMRFYSSYTKIKPKNLNGKESLKNKGINEYITKNNKSKNLEKNNFNLKNLGIKIKLSPTVKRFGKLKIYPNTEDKINIIKLLIKIKIT